MQHSVLTRQSGHTVQPRQVCLTVSCVYTHPVRGLASPRTLDYNIRPLWPGTFRADSSRAHAPHLVAAPACMRETDSLSVPKFCSETASKLSTMSGRTYEANAIRLARAVSRVLAGVTQAAHSTCLHPAAMLLNVHHDLSSQGWHCYSISITRFAPEILPALQQSARMHVAWVAVWAPRRSPPMPSAHTHTHQLVHYYPRLRSSCQAKFVNRTSLLNTQPAR